MKKLLGNLVLLVSFAALAACGPTTTTDEPGDMPGPGPSDTRDTDGDGISDSDEGRETNRDTDGDGIPDYEDDDSDGDCISDADEAGDGDLATPPADSDGDGIPDAAELDSDADGLSDSDEDLNCNGITDPGETDANDRDTDGDQVSDLVESVAGTDPLDPADNPQANGDFVFEVPYQGAPIPDEDRLDFSSDIGQADVVFAMDTTGSMGGEISALKSSLTTLIADIGGAIDNVGFGVVGYEDFVNIGGSTDTPFYLLHRVMSTNTSAGLASVQAAVNQLTTRYGGDLAESGYEMLYQVATGLGVVAGGNNVAAFNPATAPPATIPAGEDTGDTGGVGFRTGSLPIVVWMTDAPSHNSSVTGNDYAPADVTGSATSAQALGALGTLSARVIGVISQQGLTNGGLTDLTHAVNTTGAVVPPEAWGPSGARPAGCAVGQCCTGQNGAGVAAVAGECPLVFEISGTGTGLGDAVATAVSVLANFAVFDVTAEGRDDPSDSVDAVSAFVDHLEAEPTAGGICTPGLTAIDVSGNGALDTYTQVTPGATVCFDVIPKTNTTVPATGEVQLYLADVVVLGDGVAELDTRKVYFIVPPSVDGPAVE